MVLPVNFISPWRNTILQCLRKRNENEHEHLEGVLDSYERLVTQLEEQRKTNTSLLAQVEEVKKEKLELQIKADSGIGLRTSMKPDEKRAALEAKVLKLSEELTDMHRTKGQNAQRIIELSERVKELEKQIEEKEGEVQRLAIESNAYKDEIRNLEVAIVEKDNANMTIRDEHSTIQLMLSQTEETLNKVSNENAELVNRWMQEKAKEADDINRVNSIVHAQLIVKRDRDSTRSRSSSTCSANNISVSLSPPMPGISCSGSVVPSRCLNSIEAHDSEVNTVRFCPSGNTFVTAGNDRKVKVWSVSTGQFTNKGILLGSNAGVVAVDFDVQEQFVLGASNDFAIRVWGIHDHRQRHTLTGHSGKVLAARFLSDPNKIVSGSLDRTLKIWDLRNRACTKTIFAGSSCYDLVITDGAGTNIISGHFDKRIRFWDIRSDGPTHTMSLQGKITSLDLSQTDRSRLLCCTKDDSLQLIDLRQNKILMRCEAEGFKVFFDWTRAALSPDATYAAAGSQDGQVYIWNVNSGELEGTLQEHEVPVIAVSWHTSGTQLLSCDRQKKVTLWV